MSLSHAVITRPYRICGTERDFIGTIGDDGKIDVENGHGSPELEDLDPIDAYALGRVLVALSHDAGYIPEPPTTP